MRLAPPEDEPVNLPRFERQSIVLKSIVGFVLPLAALGCSLALTGYHLASGSALDVKVAAASILWLLPLPATLLVPQTLLYPILCIDFLILSCLPTRFFLNALALVCLAVALVAPRAPTSTVQLDGFESEVELAEQELEGDLVGGPESESTLNSFLFQWPLPLIRRANTVPILQPYHLPALPRNLRSRVVSVQPKVTRMFDRLLGVDEKDRGDSGEGWKKLVRNLWEVNRWSILTLISLSILKALLTFLPAWLLSQLIRSLEQHPNSQSLRTISFLSIQSAPTLLQSFPSLPPRVPIPDIFYSTQALLCLALALASAVSGILASHLAYYELSRCSEPIKIQLRTLLFKKTLRRKDVVDLGGQDEDGNGSGGGGKSAILNLFTVDVARVATFGTDSAGVVVALVDLIIGTTLLYSLLGPSSLLGIALNALTIPLNRTLASITFDVDRRRSAARDARVAAIDEVIAGIRSVKFEAGEEYWEKRLGDLRKEEVRLQRIRYWLGTVYNLVWGSLPILCLLLTFTCYTKLQGGVLTSSIAFPSLSIFNALTQVWTILPGTLIKLTEGLVSLKRLARYLDGSEVEDAKSITTTENGPAAREGILIHVGAGLESDSANAFFVKNATFSYPSSFPNSSLPHSPPLSSSTFSLRSLSLSFPIGRTTLVTGPVAAGKSLLLLGLLGEADMAEGGEVRFPKSSDQPEEPASRRIDESGWLIDSATAFVPQSPWLQHATIRSNILFGLPFFPERYAAVIQACCLVSDLKLFQGGDMCEIGERGVTCSGGQKARISLARAVYSRATHLIADDFLSAVDAHTAQELISGCLQGPLMKGRTVVLVSHHVSLVLPAADMVVALELGELKFSGSPADFAKSPSFKGILREEEEEAAKQEEDSLEPLVEEVFPTAKDPVQISEKLIKAERRQEGGISVDSYRAFLSACGSPFYWMLFAAVYLGVQANDLLTAYWLRTWTSATAQQPSPHSLDYYLSIYASITFIGVVGSATRWIVLYEGVTTRASVIIHQNLLHNVLRSPLRYFESTAHGTLLNRFSADMSRVDGWLPDDWGRVIQYSLSLFASFGVIVSVTPFFGIAIVVLAPIFLLVGQKYARITRDLRRLDSIALSPLFSLWSEVIGGGGISVLRSFGAQSRMLRKMLFRIDAQTNRYFHQFSVYLWLTTSFTVLNAVLIGAGSLLLIAKTEDAALLGFALTFALGISSGMLDLMLRYVSLELSMVAVERIKEFSVPQANLQPEITSIRPPAAWPPAGHVQVEKLTVRYASHLPDVLHDVSFEIKPGERVGVVGPTGSGKSTIALSFFRFIEAVSGRVVLDGFDIAKLGTKDLRSRLTIIPQDPTILSGTLRSALDVYGEHTDAEILESLTRVHLLQSLMSKSDASSDSEQDVLQTEIALGGSNLSAGQRQLLVLARALLRRSKLVLLDECTSSVDLETDALLTTTLREAFSSTQSTLLVIAHRLHTIISFDKILFLQAGRVMEFDSPKKLLADPEGYFYKLCARTGELEELKRLADV